ncbi:hypothetical protein N7517_007748 [Penicillium concentricum]|uniref:Acyclic terpene utilisation N-terminal domain-containing protein n=1 Tax=Penicillium concentricum TaxID=293559 RepID=A0A9W9SBS3_9EURO|nr:uncharacterized protein N7517_007748 [Penicillium concentricum]KAJ5375742.1 hypothetical protein N7517_007748 [Penicillium concentricum]
MLFRRDIRIGNVSGATGDSPHAMRRIAEDGNVDVIVGDWLSEMNIAWNAIAKDQDPSLGYGPDFLTQLSESIDIIVEKGIKVITIAGALNTPALAARVQEMSRAQGHKEVVIAMVLGDDISQVVTDPATLAVSWSADYFNARGVHSAIFSFIGAISFLASAVLPLDAYLVSNPLVYAQYCVYMNE